MSVLTYNDLTFPYVTVSRFDMDAEYEESKTDRTYTKVSLVCNAVINPLYLPIIGGAGDVLSTRNADLTNSIVALRNHMLEPKRRLSLTFNGTELIPQTAGVNGTVDARNGPQPKYCRIMDLNNNTWFMQWACEAYYWENLKFADGATAGTTNQKGNNVISNRWSERQEIDNKNYSKIVREGKYIIRSDNADGIIADDARVQMAVVGLLPGFLREGSHYNVTPDGLAIQYTITDQEQFRMPPSPAFTAKGWYTESIQGAEDGVRYGECSVVLEGGKTTSPADLIRIAVQTCVAKVNMRQAQLAVGKDVGRLLNGWVKHHLYENKVETYFKVMFNKVPNRFQGIGAFVGMSTKTPFSLADYKPPYTARGNSFGNQGAFLLQAAAYYDPSLQNTVVNNERQLSEGPEVGTTGKQGQESTATPDFG